MKDALFCESITSASTEVASKMWNVIILLLLHENGNHYCIYPLKSYLHFLLLTDHNVILLSCQGVIVNWYFAGFFKGLYYILCFVFPYERTIQNQVELNWVPEVTQEKQWNKGLSNEVPWTRCGIHVTKPCLSKADVNMRATQSRLSPLSVWEEIGTLRK